MPGELSCNQRMDGALRHGWKARGEKLGVSSHLHCVPPSSNMLVLLMIEQGTEQKLLYETIKANLSSLCHPIFNPCLPLLGYVLSQAMILLRHHMKRWNRQWHIESQIKVSELRRTLEEMQFAHYRFYVLLLEWENMSEV